MGSPLFTLPSPTLHPSSPLLPLSSPLLPSTDNYLSPGTILPTRLFGKYLLHWLNHMIQFSGPGLWVLGDDSADSGGPRSRRRGRVEDGRVCRLDWGGGPTAEPCASEASSHQRPALSAPCPTLENLPSFYTWLVHAARTGTHVEEHTYVMDLTGV